MRSLLGRHTAIGIDVGAHSIRAVQLEAPRGQYRAAAIAIVSRTDVGQPLCDKEILELGRILKRQGFHGRNIVIAAPDETLLRGMIELPRQVSGTTARQITRMELARIHQRAPDSFEMICWEPAAGPVQSATQAIAIGCPHDVANALLDIFEGNGLHVEALDARPAAVLRACAPLILTPPAVTALLDLEWSSTQLQMVRGDTVVYERFFPDHSFSDLVSHLGQRFGLPTHSACEILNMVGLSGIPTGESLDEQSVTLIRGIARSHFDALVQELRVPFEYVARHYPPEGVRRMLLMGAGAVLPALSQHFHAALGVETLTASAANTVGSHPHLLAKANNPAIAVALGLAKFNGA